MRNMTKIMKLIKAKLMFNERMWGEIDTRNIVVCCNTCHVKSNSMHSIRIHSCLRMDVVNFWIASVT